MRARQYLKRRSAIINGAADKKHGMRHRAKFSSLLFSESISIAIADVL
jgi:hypothetical protein